MAHSVDRTEETTEQPDIMCHQLNLQTHWDLCTVLAQQKWLVIKQSEQ